MTGVGGAVTSGDYRTGSRDYRAAGGRSWRSAGKHAPEKRLCPRRRRESRRARGRFTTERGKRAARSALRTAQSAPMTHWPVHPAEMPRDIAAAYSRVDSAMSDSDARAGGAYGMASRNLHSAKCRYRCGPLVDSTVTRDGSEVSRLARTDDGVDLANQRLIRRLQRALLGVSVQKVARSSHVPAGPAGITARPARVSQVATVGTRFS
jgi:hypothetical protein